jgi:hypothetical protein
MTTTIFSPETTTRTSSADALRALLDDALSVAADDAGDSFEGGTVAGRTLLAMAAVARQAAGALGADPGISILAAPGVVVVREFAAAVRLFDSVADKADEGNLDGLLAMAKGLHAQLFDAVSRTAD